MTEAEVPLCCNAACPSTVAHKEGYYNFSLRYKDEATRSHQLPEDIRKALNTISYYQSMWQLDEDQDVYMFLARFAIAHHSHLEGLMPREVTRTSMWRTHEIQEILRTAGPRPVQAPLEPSVEEGKKISLPRAAKKEEMKATAPQRRLENGMGRGVFSGKPGVTLGYPGQKTPAL